MDPLAVAHQAEGMKLERMEEKSAAKTGRSVQEWRQAVLDKLKGAGVGKKTPTASDLQMNAAAKFLEDRAWADTTKNPASNDAAFSELLSTQGYSQAKTKDLPTFRRMAEFLGGDLVYDKGWQQRTSISYVLERKNGVVTKFNYADPELQPGIVSRKGMDARLGSLVKLLKPGVPEADQPLRYASVVDGKPDDTDPKAEINIAAGQNLGNYEFDPNISGSDKVNATVVAQHPGVTRKDGSVGSLFEHPAGAQLSNAETQYAGYLAEKGEPFSKVGTKSALAETMATDKWKNDKAFQKYQEDVKKALEEQKKKLEEIDKAKKEARKKAAQAGGDRVETGIPTVLAGKDRNEIVTVESPTLSGDLLAEGRWGTYAGPKRLPVSTLESLTVQGKGVVTALETVFIAGPPTAIPA